MVMTSRRKQTKAARRLRKRVEDLTLRDLIGYFEFHNRTEGKSPQTLSWYNQSLDLFERHLLRSGMSTLIRDIDEPEVRSFIAYLQSKTASGLTCPYFRGTVQARQWVPAKEPAILQLRIGRGD